MTRIGSRSRLQLPLSPHRRWSRCRCGGQWRANCRTSVAAVAAFVAGTTAGIALALAHHAAQVRHFAAQLLDRLLHFLHASFDVAAARHAAEAAAARKAAGARTAAKAAATRTRGAAA